MNTPGPATVSTLQPEVQTDTVQPEVSEPVVNIHRHKVSDAVPTTTDADVSLISSIDANQHLQVEEIDITGISVSDCDFEQVATSQSSNSMTTHERQCSADLALYAVGLSLRPDKLDHYRDAYAKNTHLFNDPIYLTWKTFNDGCSVPDDVTCESLVLRNSTPVSLVHENDPMENQAHSHNMTCSHQTKRLCKKLPHHVLQFQSFSQYRLILKLSLTDLHKTSMY